MGFRTLVAALAVATASGLVLGAGRPGRRLSSSGLGGSSRRPAMRGVTTTRTSATAPREGTSSSSDEVRKKNQPHSSLYRKNRALYKELRHNGADLQQRLDHGGVPAHRCHQQQRPAARVRVAVQMRFVHALHRRHQGLGARAVVPLDRERAEVLAAICAVEAASRACGFSTEKDEIRATFAGTLG